MTHLLHRALAPVVQRRRRFLLLRATALIWLAICVALLAASWLAPAEQRWQWTIGLSLGALFLGLHAYLWQERWQPDYHEIARAIERRHPELHALLVTAVEQAPEPVSGQFHFLQERVIEQAVAESRRHRWLDEIPVWRWGAWGLLQLLLLPALAWLAFHLASGARWDWGRPLAPAPLAAVAPVVTVEPGNAELERGAGFIVTARFEKSVPANATLVLQPPNGPSQKLPLARHLADPVFGGGIPEVTGDFTYRIAYGDTETAPFTVHVFEHPRLDRADATLHPPAYTKLPDKLIPETRRLSGVVGSKLDVAFALNKPVASAWLEAKDGTRVPLSVAAGEGRADLKDFPLAASQSYELHLTDAEGRTNKHPEPFAIEVLPNRPPELKRKLPRGDERVSPLQEVPFEATAWDDFGLQQWGLSLTLPNGETREIVLGHETKPDERVEGRTLLRLEPLGLEPDQLITWNLWAEDLGPDGEMRRTVGDINFMEVRPFEEIYQAGDQAQADAQEKSGGAGGGAGEETTKLAELQKQIISATWNLQRREGTTTTPTPAYQKDAPVLRENQEGAATQAEAMQEKLEEAKQKAIAADVLKEMHTAIERLTAAEPAPPRLAEALAPEQKAYATLMRLASHQFSVTRGKKSGQGKGSGRQAQLDQLELKEDQNRYESKTEATQAQAQQKQELATLNRLKELAQRQQDINERLKEMQTALQEAKDETAREEAKRELQRLQEEQQKMLADMDELKQSMEQNAQQADTAEDRQRLEQTRDDAQRAAEAMREQKPTEALASGVRSEQQLQKLRDDFRQKTSSRFRDEMREMRESARELAQNEEELGQQLQQAAAPEEKGLKSLATPEPKDDVKEKFAQQRAALDELQKQMRDVSEQAEAGEPLLSRQLYDSLRKNAQAGTDETMEEASRLAASGATAQARPFEEKARKEVEELKDGVERAAESVLGNEAESLRQARGELDQLAEQVNREIARARPDLAKNEPGKGPAKPGREGARASGKSANEAKRSKEGAGDEPGKEGKQASPAGKDPADRAGNEEAKSPERTGKGNARGEKGKEQPENRAGAKGGKGEKGEQPGDGQQAVEQGDPENPTAKNGQGTSEKPGGQKGAAGKKMAQGGQLGQKGKGAAGDEGTASNGDRKSEKSGGQKGDGGVRTASGKPGGKEGGPTGKEDSNASAGGQGGGARGGERTADNHSGARRGEMVDGGEQSHTGVRSGGREAGGGGFWNGGVDDDPLTGGNYVRFADRLRNVEEMLDNRELRSEVTRVREAAGAVRTDYKRHAAEMPWDLVQMKIGTPLAELRDRVAEELARRDTKESLVPIDRDPVPPKYAERVRLYYEELGK